MDKFKGFLAEDSEAREMLQQQAQAQIDIASLSTYMQVR